FFLSVLFPHDQVRILPYNRVLKDLNGLSNAGLLQKLSAIFTVQDGGATPSRKHELSLYLDGRCRQLIFRPDRVTAADPVDKSDVNLLQKHVLQPVFGIDDPRTSQRLNFVGGIRGAEELERLVNSREYACAFSMFPTSVADLMTIADA